VSHSSPPYLLVLARFENAQEVRDAILRGFETWKPVPEEPEKGIESTNQRINEPTRGGVAFERE
jgi:hypothetical protein